jgi:hypothetical protein
MINDTDTCRLRDDSLGILGSMYPPNNPGPLGDSVLAQLDRMKLGRRPGPGLGLGESCREHQGGKMPGGAAWSGWVIVAGSFDVRPSLRSSSRQGMSTDPRRT